ncbi:Hvo_1808 family surface protein [Natrarchaeobius chitinivorans]|uniref:DUF4157 domain-containing protein n=1 Tax=Natrarchaeobius chitinivorans TaxID=1679083 RepID=A0A3N6LQE5_NATCH|nr:Hvo_1808 family surface protein [Natrarchaeobius chitinivorans]RQG91823.1 hypothetical protein EA473_18690 [Natrarchaeobius chitinivorans]
MSRLRLVAVLALVVLSGCALPGTAGQLDDDSELGHVETYAHDDVFAFDGSDTLTEEELEAVKYRSMARVELIRGEKFERDVEIDVVSREAFRDQRGDRPDASAFENERWRGAFLVDGETDANEAIEEIYAESVAGYYASDRVVIVVDDADEIRVDRQVLVHELTHALQDQRFGLEREGETLDARRAESGLLEGEANYVPYLYDQRCGEQWQCLLDDSPEPATGDELADRPFESGLFLSIFAPYAEGTSFVAHLHETGGWDAVDRAHDERPTSTAQLIHPERYPDHRPVDLEVTDRSSDDWEPITDAEGDLRTDTVGEATLFAMLWENGAVDRPLTAGGTELSPYNYSYPATAGWDGDAFVAYRDVDDENRTGHVWELAWERESDADAFAEAYRTLLENRGGEPIDAAGERYVISDAEAFAGAYRVDVSGETVEIVGAPSVEELEAIRAEEPPAVASPAITSPAVASPAITLPAAKAAYG